MASPRRPAPSPAAASDGRAQSRWSRWIIPSLVAAALVIGTLLLFASPLRVTNIQIAGGAPDIHAEARRVVADFLREHAVLGGAPRLFLVRRESLARLLQERFPPLATVQVLRRLPGTLELHLQERVAVALLETPQHRFSIDAEGAVIREEAAATRSGELPVIRDERELTGYKPRDVVVSAAVMKILHEVIVRLPDALAVTVDHLTIPADGSTDVRVTTAGGAPYGFAAANPKGGPAGGWTLLLDTQQPLDAQLRALETLFRDTLSPDALNRLDVVDLRVAGKIYYRVRP